jgi:hypothetical protein
MESMTCQRAEPRPNSKGEPSEPAAAHRAAGALRTLDQSFDTLQAPQPDARAGCLHPEIRAFGGRRAGIWFASRLGRQSASCLPSHPRASLKRSVRRSKLSVTTRDRLPLGGYCRCKRSGSRDWRQRPAAGRPRRGAGESYGVAAHRRRAVANLPKTAAKPLFLSVGSSEPGFAFYFLPTPIRTQ